MNCRRDPEVNKQNANFRNLINGNELAIIDKLLSVEESVSACAELSCKSSCRNTELRLLKLQILSSGEAPAGGTALSGIAPGSPI